MRCIRWLRIASILAICTATAVSGQETQERQSLAIAEVGAAPSWSIPGLAPTFSPTVAVEFTPIEHWLEIEIGATPTFSHRSTEWGTDFLFKKPWTISKKAEVMFGVGPEWIHKRSEGSSTNSIAGEAALDFMFWPAPQRRWGWYLEPAYEYEFARNHERSIGVSGGLLIKLP